MISAERQESNCTFETKFAETCHRGAVVEASDGETPLLPKTDLPGATQRAAVLRSLQQHRRGRTHPPQALGRERERSKIGALDTLRRPPGYPVSTLEPSKVLEHQRNTKHPVWDVMLASLNKILKFNELQQKRGPRTNLVRGTREPTS